MAEVLKYMFISPKTILTANSYTVNSIRCLYKKSFFLVIADKFSLLAGAHGSNTVRKVMLLSLALLMLTAGMYAQESAFGGDGGTTRIAVSVGPEWNMNARENFAAAAMMSADYNLPFSFAAGLNFAVSSNFQNITIVEPAAMFRWYFLRDKFVGHDHSGFFAQADLGISMVVEQDGASPMFMGGLRGGFRLPLTELFYVEPYGRIGYPFAFGIGALAGVRLWRE